MVTSDVLEYLLFVASVCKMLGSSVVLPLVMLCFLYFFSTFNLDTYGHTLPRVYSTNSMKVMRTIPHFILKLDPEEIEKLGLFWYLDPAGISDLVR